jgi:hypothetical protein
MVQSASSEPDPKTLYVTLFYVAAAVSKIIGNYVCCMSCQAGSSVLSVNSYSVEDRTRMSQNSQRRQSRLESFDDQFESELPPEIRAELQVIRIPTTEQEIQAAIAWLKSRGYLPTVSAPSSSGEPPLPPIPEPVSKALTPHSPPRPFVMPPVAKPVQRASRSGSGIWLLLALLLGFPILIGQLPQAVSTLRTLSGRPVDDTQPQSRPVEVRRALPVPVEVRRALPAVPRALPVTSQASTVSNTGWWQSIRMPDGSIIWVRYQGELPYSAALPAQGDFIGQEYSVGNTSWIWMTRPGASSPSWVDP